jgi:hypothetical protein
VVIRTICDSPLCVCPIGVVYAHPPCAVNLFTYSRSFLLRAKASSNINSSPSIPTTQKFPAVIGQHWPGYRRQLWVRGTAARNAGDRALSHPASASAARCPPAAYRARTRYTTARFTGRFSLDVGTTRDASNVNSSVEPVLIALPTSEEYLRVNAPLA